MEKKNGFTILEMMIVMLIVALLLLITLPNIQQKEKIIDRKSTRLNSSHLEQSRMPSSA